MDMMSYLMGRNAGGKNTSTVVVDELPDVGQPNVIYLVPKEDTGDNDVFDEYLWVDDDWEHIGTTAIDLSDYYTKSEVNNLLIPMYKITTNERVIDSQETVITDIKSSAAEMIMDIVNNNSKFAMLLFCARGKADLMLPTYTIEKNANSYTFFTYTCAENTLYQTSIFASKTITIIGSWENDTFTTGMVQYKPKSNLNFSDILLKDNTTSYTPTGDYNPATKKYVDDSIASAITDALGGNY